MQDAIRKIIDALNKMNRGRKGRQCCIIIYADGDCSIQYPGEPLNKWITVPELAAVLDQCTDKGN